MMTRREAGSWLDANAAASKYVVASHDAEIMAAALRIRNSGLHGEIGAHPGAVVGLVYVEGSRPLLLEDERAACFYEPGRQAWPLSRARKLARPVVMRGPQKIQFLARAQVLEAM